jgi:hypothetical protein
MMATLSPYLASIRLDSGIEAQTTPRSVNDMVNIAIYTRALVSIFNLLGLGGVIQL